jgi:hypothetical protein
MTRDDRIAENRSVDACIKECFQHLHDSDVKRFIKDFRSQPHEKDQVHHTFRELLFGSYLARDGWRVRAYQKIDGKTPDWAVFGDQGELTGIIDVVNLHPDKATDDLINTQLRKGEPVQLAGDDAADSKRVYDKVKEKCIIYRDIVASRHIPYIIGLFPQFQITIDRSQVIDNLYVPPFGLFLTEELGGYPNVSGLAFLSEPRPVVERDALWMGYYFEYFPNPHARHPCEFPPGIYCNQLLVQKRAEYLKIIEGLKAETDFNMHLMHVLNRNHMADVYGPLLSSLRARWPDQADTR